MSYPQLLSDSAPGEDYVLFTVPNRQIARKIERDSGDEQNLRIQVSAKALLNKLEELVSLFSKSNLEASPITGRHEVRVKLFVPPPPPDRLILIPSVSLYSRQSSRRSRQMASGNLQPTYVARTQGQHASSIGLYGGEKGGWGSEGHLDSAVYNYKNNAMNHSLRRKPRLPVIEEEEEDSDGGRFRPISRQHFLD